MDVVRKYIVIFGSSFALSGILILSMMARCRCRKEIGQGSDKSVYEKLRDSKIALDKAASAIQCALDDMEHQVA